MLETGINEQTRRKELRAKRDLLFERFSTNPSEIHLVIEIKSMDDQVEESLFHCNREGILETGNPNREKLESRRRGST
jgi:hypothetical protein